MSVEERKGQDRSSGESVFQCVECRVASRCPQPWSAMFKETVEGCSDGREMMNKTPVVASEAKESLQLCSCCRLRKGLNRCNLLRIRLETRSRDDVAQIWDRRTTKETL